MISDISFKEISDDYMEELVDDISYVLLKEEDNNLMLNCSKVIGNDKGIFIFDRFGKNTLQEYDGNGTFVRQYGVRGSGPDEYSKAWDFDVDSTSVYLYDRGTKRILIYDLNGNLIRRIPLDCRPEAISSLDDGRFIMVLPDDGENNPGRSQIAVIDSTGNYISRYLNYGEYSFGVERLSDNLLRKCGDSIVYQQALSDSLYIFDSSGDLVSGQAMDFGKKSIPGSKYKAYTEFLEDGGKKKYAFLSDTPIICKNWIIGNIFNAGERGIVCQNLGNGKGGFFSVKPDQVTPHIPLFPISIEGDDLVSVIDYDIFSGLKSKEWVPDSVRKHIENGNKALLKYHLKI